MLQFRRGESIHDASPQGMTLEESSYIPMLTCGPASSVMATVMLLPEALNCTRCNLWHACQYNAVAALQLCSSHATDIFEQQQCHQDRWIQGCTTYRSQHENTKRWLEEKRPEGVPRIQQFLQHIDGRVTRPCQQTLRLAMQIINAVFTIKKIRRQAWFWPVVAPGVTRCSSFTNRRSSGTYCRVQASLFCNSSCKPCQGHTDEEEVSNEHLQQTFDQYKCLLSSHKSVASMAMLS